MPFRVWRVSDELLHDTRVKSSNGKPLRASQNLSCVMSGTGETSKSSVHGIYSGHIGCMIVGYDQWRWTAHLAVDTWFETSEDVEGKVERYQYDLENGMVLDPLTCGKDDATKPIWHPRAYFLRVMALRLSQVKDEWELVLQHLDTGVSRLVSCPGLYKDSHKCANTNTFIESETKGAHSRAPTIFSRI